MKILIACPTSDVKSYCQTEWIKNTLKIRNHSGCDILIIDNSATNKNKKEFEKHHIPCKQIQFKKDTDIGEKLKVCTNVIREHFLSGGYDYWFSLESDIFPPVDVLDRLLSHQKQIVCAPYFHYSKNKARMLIFDIWHTGLGRLSRAMHPLSSFVYCDGQLRRAYQTGIGCMLIHRSVFDIIGEFRMANKGELDFGQAAMPDYYFHLDLLSKDIPVYCDTSFFVRHENTDLRWRALFGKEKGGF